MRLFARKLLLVIGILLSIPLILLAAVFGWLAITSKSSNIVDFRPVDLAAVATAHFFYSVGIELRNSNEITNSGEPLVKGELRNFLVSPDHDRIAIVIDGQLSVVSAEGGVRTVVAVDSIYRDKKPIGKHFFRDSDFQWSRDSKSLYVIGDEFYDSQGSQLFSKKGELWRYDLETGKAGASA